VDNQYLEWLDFLGRGLMWSAVAVLALAVIGAVAIATSQNNLPVVEDIQRESRGVLAIAALGGGITSAGVLAGLGAILRLMVSERRERE
jgi:ABC-type Na+ efflux pump permease subunit